MAVYVDRPLFRLGRMRMSHMWADDVAELHDMATRLGLRRDWFQSPPRASWEHYDVSLSTRARAVGLGAVETDRYGAVEWRARRDGDAAKLASVAKVRALRPSDPDGVHHHDTFDASGPGVSGSPGHDGTARPVGGGDTTRS